MKFAFISRSNPAPEQRAIAAALGHTLAPVGYADLATVTAAQIAATGDYDGIVVDDPGAVERLCTDYAIGVFQDAAPDGFVVFPKL
jgi:hypothetical protein